MRTDLELEFTIRKLREEVSLLKLQLAEAKEQAGERQDACERFIDAFKDLIDTTGKRL